MPLLRVVCQRENLKISFYFIVAKWCLHIYKAGLLNSKIASGFCKWILFASSFYTHPKLFYCRVVMKRFVFGICAQDNVFNVSNLIQLTSIQSSKCTNFQTLQLNWNEWIFLTLLKDAAQRHRIYPAVTNIAYSPWHSKMPS